MIQFSLAFQFLSSSELNKSIRATNIFQQREFRQEDPAEQTRVDAQEAMGRPLNWDTCRNLTCVICTSFGSSGKSLLSYILRDMYVATSSINYFCIIAVIYHQIISQGLFNENHFLSDFIGSSAQPLVHLRVNQIQMSHLQLLIISHE